MTIHATPFADIGVREKEQRRDSSLASCGFSLSCSSKDSALSSMPLEYLSSEQLVSSMVSSSSKVTGLSRRINAAGGMYIIMGFLWLIGIPVLVVAIVMLF